MPEMETFVGCTFSKGDTPSGYNIGMEETERLELAKAVLACAPKGMGAIAPFGKVKRSYEEVEFRGIESGIIGECGTDGTGFERKVALDFSRDDIYNSQGIIAMLDAMEEAGHDVSVHARHDEDDGTVEYETECGQFSFFCSTRAKSVARAFVAVFGEKQ